MEESEIREIARTNIKYLFNTTIDSFIEKAFEFEDKDPDEYLTSTHFAFREMFNETKGTGRGITGFSELWYFLYIKKFLERFLKIKFETIKTVTPRATHHHYEADCKGNKLILSSDISIESNFKLKISNKSTIKPDIFIGIKKNNKEIIPVAIFEIKLHQKKASNIEKVFNRFVEMKDTLNADNRNLPFFIFLYLQHSEYTFSKKKQERIIKFNIQLDRFKNLFGKDMLMVNRISKWDKKYENKIEGSIYHIMDKIISFINEI